MNPREILDVHEKIICSPVTGSMRPLIRPKTDCVILKKTAGPLKKYDVVIYGSEGKNVLHRVVGVPETGAGEEKRVYLIRGDANTFCEHVPAERIYGVMEGMYRGPRYISCDSFLYRLLSRLIVAANPLISCRRKIRRRLSGIRPLRAGYRKMKAAEIKIKGGSRK